MFQLQCDDKNSGGIKITLSRRNPSEQRLERAEMLTKAFSKSLFFFPRGLEYLFDYSRNDNKQFRKRIRFTVFLITNFTGS